MRRIRTLLLAAAAALATAGAPARGQATTAPAAASTPSDEFPDRWYYYGRERPTMARLRSLEGRPVPPLTVDGWVGTPRTLEDLRGSVVVVEFWGTWCRPCVAAIPKNRAMVSHYIERDFAFVGVHSTQGGNGWTKDAAVRLDINYPVAVDVGNATARRWNVSFWPTYAVLDRGGIVRAIGLRPDHVRPVVEKVIAEVAPSKSGRPAADPAAGDDEDDDIPARWLDGPGGRRRMLAPLLAADAAPPVESGTWLNSDPLELPALRGRVVLLGFWSLWSAPSLQLLDELDRLHDALRDEGLVVIGVCAPRDGERMQAAVRERELDFPVCLDERGLVARRYKATRFPELYLVDRGGRLRIADCKPRFLEDAARRLLAEPGPE